MNTQNTDNVKMSENIIIADADYVDSVAFNLIVNFERMIGRAIPKADLSQWAVCIALDGGVREGKNNTQIVLVHDKKNTCMDNFTPSDYDKDLNSKAGKQGMQSKQTGRDGRHTGICGQKIP